MLVSNSHLIGTPVLSVQTGDNIGRVVAPVIDPNELKIIAFYLAGPGVNKSQNLVSTNSIREYSNYGFVIDDVDELIGRNDVIKISEILKLNFNLLNLKVETKKGTKLGKIIGYTVTSEDFIVQQIIVKRPILKSFSDPTLTISRKEIIEITDYKVIIKSEEDTLKKHAETEEFVPNFINPFRTSPGFAPTDTEDND